MGAETPRAEVLGALRRLWRLPIDEIETAAAEEPHGPGALSETEIDRLNAEVTTLQLDAPEWTEPLLKRAFGDMWREELDALSSRADIDLRINALKATSEKAMAALKGVNAKPAPILKNAARIVAPDPSERAPAVTVIPAFNKGWVEVQDLGSQIAAAAAGRVQGLQVLDYCAGGGGKTLALAAMMKNTGQLYAYDIDARRLKPLFHRAKRAGVRNLQIRSPAGEEGLDDLRGKMDVVFVDAPCSGSGTWRRHPDAKWRLTEKQLNARMTEQDAVLDAASAFVKPGGCIVYVTCSIFREENDDRVAAFMQRHERFEQISTCDQIAKSGLGVDAGQTPLKHAETEEGALRLSPAKFRTDGFYIAAFLCGGSH